MKISGRPTLALATTLALGITLGALPQQKNTSRPEFTVVMRGEGTDADGLFVAFTTYEGAPGFRLSQIHRMCATEKEAHEYFEKQLTRFKVVSREPKKDKTGKVVGERAEVLLIRDKGKEPIPEILFTIGSDYLEIGSSSRDANLELEKYLSP
jgi:hypothetical protein